MFSLLPVIMVHSHSDSLATNPLLRCPLQSPSATLNLAQYLYFIKTSPFQTWGGAQPLELRVTMSTYETEMCAIKELQSYKEVGIKLLKDLCHNIGFHEGKVHRGKPPENLNRRLSRYGEVT
ncbi:hypothetical protein ACH5RR_023389 [Cinchona calisaya]|uniref:Uncharacterized protein n=1 Tax=Cinchona calisaya TaxID=153742 RepID=A0ABD2ZDN7_9GENT